MNSQANTILSSLATIFTFLLSVLVLSEKFTYRKLAGVTLCVLGTALVTLRDAASVEALLAGAGADGEEVDAGEAEAGDDFMLTHGGKAEWVAMAIQTASGGRMDRSAIGEHLTPPHPNPSHSTRCDVRRAACVVSRCRASCRAWRKGLLLFCADCRAYP